MITYIQIYHLSWWRRWSLRWQEWHWTRRGDQHVAWVPFQGARYIVAQHDYNKECEREH